jgi:hypothetical protein
MNANLPLCLALDNFLIDGMAVDKVRALEQTERVAVLQLQLMCLYIHYTILFFRSMVLNCASEFYCA